MAKTVFRPQETVHLTSAYVLNAPGGHAVAEEVEDAEPALEYEGPTADDLRLEAENFKQNWEREKEAMMAAARAEAQDIVAKAEATAFEEVKRKNDQALKIRRDAESAAEKALKEAEVKIQAFEAQAKSRVDEVTKAAHKEGFDQGREEGFKEGRTRSSASSTGSTSSSTARWTSAPRYSSRPRPRS
jgi:flagellar assembly protein FliH